MKKLVLALLAISTIAFSCQARTSELVGKGEGYGPYNGWVVADMSMNDGVVSEVAAYSMRTFKDYGLVPVAYCASGGSHLGTYYLFYVNPYHDAVIIGWEAGVASHVNPFAAKSKPFDKTGEFIHYTDMQVNQDLYRKIINVAKAEFNKYQQITK
ncbi:MULTISPECIES: hypothetical protein [Veillonella]|jgi:lipoprotein|uniref:hypothetical protein n=1 Tax=Veillonella TaxID=29465 RepID=UPI001EB1521A|nr:MULTISPECIES: hypothetical protein [Veillonella]MBS6327940.1 hypothetical protein [Veillonella sp.]